MPPALRHRSLPQLLLQARTAHDQRRVHVSLSPRGQAMACRIVRQVDAVCHALDAELGTEPLQRPHDRLAHLLGRLDAAATQGPRATLRIAP